ncbi:MAG: UDP-N-acetylmuramoyl-tripeptide--D-alanyl-D-alanine ligase [Chromatiaceae bacterium]|nr:MAG: UDP-N-acetylmuramoyl-tripeptide--D-alanyl-D-alanine ligase [Chromatiaceae bacterium]
MWSLAASAAAVGGQLTGPDAPYLGVVTDTRGDCRGQLFVALRGARFDGHDYVMQAAAQGAAAAMVERPVAVDLPQWVLPDTRLALGRLAAAWRQRIPARVVAITGSNGKTTVKEMVAAILSQCGPTRATAGNLNNDIGMPLTLLAARDEAYLILEMGANHAGEIGYLTDLARPAAALITNAGRAHLEGFGSLEGVARAKGEIARGLPADGTFVFMADCPWTPLWQSLAAGRPTLTFGAGPSAQVRAEAASITTTWDADGFATRFQADLAGQPVALSLGLAGAHNVHNALAASALVTALGVAPATIQAGLASLRPVPRRLQPRLGSDGRRLIDDTYNANPDSLAAAVAVLVGLPGRPVLVLGDFAELGPDSATLHREMGAAARAAGVAALYAVGPLAAAAVDGFGPGARHCPDQAALIATVAADTGPDAVILVKGSRSAAMERVADALCHGWAVAGQGQGT